MTHTSKDVLVIHTDGGSRGNPGPSAAAFWLPQLGYGGSEFLGTQTNNYAEYQGLILGLKEAYFRGVTRVSVFTDSTLMANQVNGVWRVKSEDIRPLWEQVQIRHRYAGKFQNRLLSPRAERRCRPSGQQLPGRHKKL